jgi:predicted metal-dependent hydrolase
LEKFKCPIATIKNGDICARGRRRDPASAMMPDSTFPAAQSRKTRMDSREKDRLYQKGLEAFNSAHFYDAHEHWEEVWLETPNPDKMFLQGLIQVAAAFHHYSRANLLGTRKLLRAGLLKLDRFPEVHGGLEIEALREAVRGWLAALEVGEIPDTKKPPRIGRHKGAPRPH